MKAFLITHFMPSFIVRLFAKPYVAGDSLEKGIDKARHLWIQRGIASTIDLLGEEITTKEEVEEILDIYLDVVDAIKKEEFSSFATVSIKPTSLGVDISKEYCIDNIKRILTSALESNIGVTIDMESSRYTDVTLEIFHQLKPDFPNFGTVLQTRLFRTEKDISELNGLNAHIRLCIGIYIEDKSIAYTKKSEMKTKLVEYTKLLLDHNHYVEVATHDEKTIVECLEIIEDHGGSQVAEFQMLLGVPRDKIQEELLEKGYIMRYYVPFATEWKYATNYLRRRLIENPRLAIYTLRNLFGRVLQPFRRKTK
ncbi:MAG: proline dehydrogenase family protein [Candidatus Heimdallarchaeota archaeon]|nr:MAG: proline dehydrogenase family protein [Candidatus Heimdallarchaeota archaeon]